MKLLIVESGWVGLMGVAAIVCMGRVWTSVLVAVDASFAVPEGAGLGGLEGAGLGEPVRAGLGGLEGAGLGEPVGAGLV